jgi:3-oxoacyl-[acyl-carrier-protein] synthase III
MRVFLCDGGGALVLTRDPPEPKADATGLAPARPAFELWDTFIESAGGAEEPQMYSRYGSASVAPEAIARGDHHVTQNMAAVGAMAVEVFLAGFQRFADQLGIHPGDPEVIDQVAYFLANVPSDHLVEATHEEFARRYGVPVEVARRQYYSTVAGRGYTGPAALPITLDQLFRERKVPDGKFLISFVTESSKWMNAGLLLRSRS